MEYRERVKQLLHEGKVSVEQAELLLNALKESDDRKQRVFRQVISQKEKRARGMWGFLSVWIVIVLFFISFFAYTGVIRKTWGRDVENALDYFVQASAYLEKEEYEEAIRSCKKAIEETPGFPLGYALIGVTYRLLYEKTKDASVKEKELAAFQKAGKLRSASGRRGKMNTISIVFAFVFFVLVLGLISVAVLLLYNGLARREEQVNEAWAQVGTLYQRKLDLIPALLDAVKSYAQHEKDTLQLVTESRAHAQCAIENTGGLAVSQEGKFKEFLESQGKVSLGLGKVFALAESYPDLKADAHYSTLQGQLLATEDAISSEREIYNTRVRYYNSALRYFPSNVIAAACRFEPKEYFKGKEM